MQSQRYSKQIQFDEITESGQALIRDAKAAIIGIGATGSHIANNLVRIGIGKIILIDRDFVELDNLHRQILYDELDAQSSLPKAVAAQNKLELINSEVQIFAHVTDAISANIGTLLDGVDIVLDGTDNLLTRYLINDYCQKHEIPWIYSGIIGGHGVSIAFSEAGPCLKCYLPNPPLSGQIETCETFGVLGTTASAIAAISTNQAIKYLLKKNISTNVYHINVWDPEVISLPIHKNPQCSCCSFKKFDFLNGFYDIDAVKLCGRNTVQIQNPNPENFDLSLIAQRISKLDSKFVYTNEIIKFRVDNFEILVFKDGRAMIKGTDEVDLAKSLYSKYIGN